MAAEHDLAGKVIGCAMSVHRALGHGFLENVYRNAMLIELESRQLTAVAEAPIEIFYREIEVGLYLADVLVGNSLVVEIKTVEVLSVRHQVQLVNSPTGTGIEVGLLPDFGRGALKYSRKSRALPKRQ